MMERGFRGEVKSLTCADALYPLRLGEGRENHRFGSGEVTALNTFTSSPSPFSTLEKGNFVMRRC
jgi:hypothetical protein